MRRRSRFGYRAGVPSVTTQKGQTRELSYLSGINTYKDNDDKKPTELELARDGRMVKIGRYKTRKGLDRYTVPVGETLDAAVTSTTGADVLVVDGTHSVAQKLTAGTTGALTMAEVNIQTTSTSRGTLLVEVYADTSGVPGALLGQSSLLPASVPGSFAYVPCYFVNAPSITAADVLWLVVRGQDENVGQYEVSTTTDSSDALTGGVGGSWTPESFSINTRISLSTAGAVKGVYRAYRSNGLALTLFVAGTVLYSVDDVTGAVTSVQTGLSSSATKYRFAMAQDAVYIVNEFEKPYKYDLTTDTVSQVSTAPAAAYLVIEHKGLVFYGNSTDRSQTFFSNFGLYDTFTSTDFLTVMAPKSPDVHTAYAKLNGVLYIFARRNKFVVFGDNNATWSLDEAPSQRGTFRQESVVYDADYIWHADSDGIWQFNGTEDRNIAEPILDTYLNILDKESIVLEKWGNRLYCFYTPNGGAVNSECLVFNLQLGLPESFDARTYIGTAFARHDQDDHFIQGSSRVGALYYAERDSNPHDNLGAQLEFEVATAFNHFDTPGQLKRAPMWRPQFPSVTGQYGLEAGYATDHSTTVTWADVDLSANNPRFNTGLKFDDGVHFATDRGITPRNLLIAGEWQRVQRHYRHIAAHEPVELDSEILSIETQRMI